MEKDKVRPTMLIVLGIGLLGAIFLPAMKINIISFFGTIPMEFSLRESVNALFNTGRGWAVALAAIGVFIVAANTLGYEDIDKDSSGRWLTGGAILTLLFPINLLRAMDTVVADVTNEAEGMATADASLAAGLIVPSIAVIVVAALAWYANSQESRQPVITTTQYTAVSTSDYSAVYQPTDISRPKWMTGSGPR